MIDLIRWFRRRPIEREIAKHRLQALKRKYKHCSRRWETNQSNMNMSTLRLMEAKIIYYEECFRAWGKYRPEFSFNDKQNKKYEDELTELQIPFEKVKWI